MSPDDAQGTAGSSGAPEAVALLRRHGQATDAYLRSLLARQSEAPREFVEAIEYSLFAGGKRLRPALVLECAETCGKADQSALAAAGAVELVHTFSLVHDDLPAMDDDDLRRGRPTSHKVFGEAMAILAGDAMVALAFEALAADGDPAVAPALCAELARATGPLGMIGGQVLDIEGENVRLSLDQLQHLHRMKTGALLTAACRMGAIAAKASPQRLEALTRYGQHLGLAFQIVDDVLDLTSTPEQLGKATGKDAGRGKNTYPAVLGLQASRDEAERQRAAASAAAGAFGPAARGLQAFALFVTRRQS